MSENSLIEYIKELDHIFSRLIYRVRVLHNRYTVDEITDTQFIVLRALRKGPCNTSFLAHMLGVTLSAVTALINRLHRMGLVTRQRHEKDRRQVLITITPKGIKLLGEVEEKRNLLLALYLAKVSEEERTQLLELLRKAVNLFEQEEIPDEDSLNL
ncbi:MAG: MarR family transcriptional regulator [Firmicutes bacterium]|nr:MarR family transcriptional regulator [Bacillota bacterium]